MSSADGTFSANYLVLDQGPHILAATWFMTTLAMIGVGGRLFIRYVVLKRGNAEDCWMFGGLTFLVALAAMITYMADLGGFRHEATLNASDASTVRKYFWAAQPVGSIGLLLPKISIGLQLLYILPQSSSYNWQRWVIYGSIATCFLFAALTFPLSFSQCDPRSAQWAPAIEFQGHEHNPNCWDPSVSTGFFAFTAIWNALVDMLLAFIPIALIMGLQIRMLKKALLINFLGARCFAFVSAIVKASYIAKYGFLGTGLGTEHDFTWQAFNILLWQVAEQFCLCFCGSVPAFKAMFDRWHSKRSSLRQSGGLTYVGSTAAGTSRGTRSSRMLREKDWFYERKCFEDISDSRITVTTTIDVERQRPSNSSETIEHNLKALEQAHVRSAE